MSEKNPPIPINSKNPLTDPLMNEDEGDEIVTLTDEEGQDHEFVLVDLLELNEQEYAILLPFAGVSGEGEADENAEDADMEAVILRIETDDAGDEQLVEIDDEQEWQSVVDAYEAMLEDGDGEGEGDDEGGQ